MIIKKIKAQLSPALISAIRFRTVGVCRSGFKMRLTLGGKRTNQRLGPLGRPVRRDAPALWNVDEKQIEPRIEGGGYGLRKESMPQGTQPPSTSNLKTGGPESVLRAALDYHAVDVPFERFLIEGDDA